MRIVGSRWRSPAKVHITACPRLSAMGFSESEVIAVLARIFSTTDSKLLVGIGDDAAVVSGHSVTVITTDMAVEGTHFKKQWSSAFEIGRKVCAANCADILAMGAVTDHLVVSVSLTGDEEISWIEDLARGMKYEADLAGASIVGGDLAKAQQITISMTAIGHCATPILRSGARPGDAIYLSSLTGWSAAGLVMKARDIGAVTQNQMKAIDEFSAPNIDYSIDFLSATSLCDISDALVIQGEQMATASEVGFIIDRKLIEDCAEYPALNLLAQELALDVWELIFQGGEDHVLLATGMDLPGIRIGSVIEGSGLSGLELKKAPVAWRHFL